MKIQTRQIESFLKSPDPAARIILVYGPDHGLVKERIKTLALTVVSDINDPFNVASLSGDILAEDPARLSDEANAISMMGGDRLVTISDAGDKLTTLLKAYLEAPSQTTLILLQADDLGPRSSLRKLCESAKNAAAIPCYVDDQRSITGIIRQTIQEHGLMVKPQAQRWLSVNISGDRQKVMQELDKLVTYKGDEKTPISLSDVQACCGEAGALQVSDLVYALAGGQSEQALRSYQKLLAEGISFMAVLRAVQEHFRKLHITQSRLNAGEGLDQAMKSLRPRVFFKQEALFKAQLQRWSPQKIMDVLSKLNQIEAECKTTGMLPDILCGQMIVSIGLTRPR